VKKERSNNIIKGKMATINKRRETDVMKLYVSFIIFLFFVVGIDSTSSESKKTNFYYDRMMSDYQVELPDETSTSDFNIKFYGPEESK
jgi:hypothetical protein